MQKKATYKVVVEYARTFEIEAESLGEARLQAEERASDQFIEACKNEIEQGYSAMRHLFNTSEHKEPMDWRAQAEGMGKDIAGDLSDEIAVGVKQYRENNEDGVREALKEGDEYDADSDAVKEIYDELYQSDDIVNRAWEYADGHFIYNNTSALIEAMQCIDELSEYSSGDRGLWEGVEEYERIIQIQATEALEGGILASAEEAIKEEIADALNRKFCGVCFKDQDEDGRCGCINADGK